MKRVKRRGVAVLLLAGLLAAGMIFYIVEYFIYGGEWASFAANRHIYKNGALASGRILDRNGEVLYDGESGSYSGSYIVRLSTLHAVGDRAGNIGTAAKAVFADKVTGYDPVNGAYSVSGSGNDLYLTIDADLNETAYNALDGRKGTVAVYNYKTGEILCMVSNPAFDPEDPPDVESNQEKYKGVYINRFLSSVYTPGSTFKVVTTEAALDLLDDIEKRTFVCTGSMDIGDTIVTCPSVHGEMSLSDAFAKSCNCAYAEMSLELGVDAIEGYAEKAGLLETHDVDGITTAAGSFERAEDDGDLAWSGIGQYNDLVNPCAMLRYMGAIANRGVPTEPRLISKLTTHGGIPAGVYFSSKGERIMSESMAEQLSEMMRYNVTYGYGQGGYPGLEICAKSGTAEVGSGNEPHAWFVGFLRDDEDPLAFVVIVENGGKGAAVAGSIANQVLQEAVK